MAIKILIPIGGVLLFLLAMMWFVKPNPSATAQPAKSGIVGIVDGCRVHRLTSSHHAIYVLICPDGRIGIAAAGL